MGIKHAAYGGTDVAGSVYRLACPPGRSHVLRAAWRPCSRGPTRRAFVAHHQQARVVVVSTVGASSGCWESLSVARPEILPVAPAATTELRFGGDGLLMSGDSDTATG